MDPNPVVRALGFGPEDRVAIVHADDVGLCQAGIAALADLVEFGLVSCGALMVPCPWFPFAATGGPGLSVGGRDRLPAPRPA